MRLRLLYDFGNCLMILAFLKNLHVYKRAIVIACSEAMLDAFLVSDKCYLFSIYAQNSTIGGIAPRKSCA